MIQPFTCRPALIAYVTCGDPDLATTRDIVLTALDAGAALVELGVPFSDPVADGPVIQRASERALRQGVTLEHVLRLAASIRSRSSAGMILFSYFNPVLQYGLDRFATAAAQAGLDGALITDLAVEEAGEYLRCMRARKLATVFLAAPTSTDARLRAIARASTGLVYAVSRTGVTGTRRQLTGDARSLVRRLRRYTKLPIALGFGISTPAQFRSAGRFADAVVVGSAIVETIERSGRRRAAAAVAKLIGEMKG
ncbi:MAG: tryptophan synthase subunit alpha [Acidobacteria bacterium]|nr:tryptophan synthase subunit alpha [Acidobacteriota bacterium]